MNKVELGLQDYPILGLPIFPRLIARNIAIPTTALSPPQFGFLSYYAVWGDLGGNQGWQFGHFDGPHPIPLPWPPPGYELDH